MCVGVESWSSPPTPPNNLAEWQTQQGLCYAKLWGLYCTTQVISYIKLHNTLLHSFKCSPVKWTAVFFLSMGNNFPSKSKNVITFVHILEYVWYILHKHNMSLQLACKNQSNIMYINSTTCPPNQISKLFNNPGIPAMNSLNFVRIFTICF